MQAEAAEGSRAGTISYKRVLANFECGGNLTALLVNGTTYELGETITFGPCINGGTVRLIHDAAIGTLDYEWDAPGGRLAARGVLRRKE